MVDTNLYHKVPALNFLGFSKGGKDDARAFIRKAARRQASDGCQKKAEFPRSWIGERPADRHPTFRLWLLARSVLLRSVLSGTKKDTRS